MTSAQDAPSGPRPLVTSSTGPVLSTGRTDGVVARRDGAPLSDRPWPWTSTGSQDWTWGWTAADAILRSGALIPSVTLTPGSIIVTGIA